jgi:hypothetical protein
MKRLSAFAIKAACSTVAILACGISNADYTISNENVSIGIDEFSFVGNMLSVFEDVGGRLDTGGPHDFWFDGFGGFARTTMTIRDSGGGLLAQRNDGLGWSFGPIITPVTSPGMDSVVIEGQPMPGVSFRRVIRIDAGTKYARVTDTFTNNLGMVINPGVLDNINPISPFGPNTFNDLQNVLGINDMATATIAPENTLTVGFGSDDPAMRFSAGGSQFVSNPFIIAILDPNGAFGDGTLQAASNFGMMLPDTEFSHTWYIAFGSTKAESTSVYVGATGGGVLEIGPVGNQFVDEHTLMSVSVPINNPGGGPVTWNVIGPAGMTISPTGVINWTPGELDGGTSHNVDVEAMVGASTATTSFTVNVIETNTPPPITERPNQNVDEGGMVSVDFDATDPDIPVQILTFSLASGPAGATVNSVTGVFEWTTNESHGPGTFPVTVRVTDNGDGLLFDETTFDVIVAEVNEAPTVGTITDKTVAVGSTLSLTATAMDPDVPVNTLTFSLDAGAPSGATIHAQTGAFSWTPGIGDVGNHLIVVRVTDDGNPAMSDTEDFNVHVIAPSLSAEYTGDHAGEYSDPTTLSMRVTDNLGNPIQNLSIDFALGTYAGSDLTDSNGVAEVTLILNQPAGNPGVTISFAGNGSYDPFSRNEAYEILREKVIVSYFGDTNVMTASPQITRGAIRLYATAVQENDGFPGNFTGAMLMYKGFLAGNPGPTPDVEAGPVPIGANGRAVTFKSVPVGEYSFDVKMADNDYWRVAPSVQFGMKVSPNNGIFEATGSGWVPFGVGNGHGTYQFKVGKDKAVETGASTFVYDSTDGFRYSIAVTSWLQGAVIRGTGSQAWKTAFTGYGTVVKTNLLTGVATTFLGMPVTFDAWDGNLAPNKPDAYGVLVLDGQGLVWLETPTILNIGGGNIMIK